MSTTVRRDMLDILRCPGCGGRLALTVEEEQAGRVVAGTLRCSSCAEAYPIERGIPSLLPPRSRQPGNGAAGDPGG